MAAWGAAAGIVGASIIGNMQSERARRSAENRMNEIMAQFQSIQVPTPEEQELILEEFRSAGLLTPEMEEAILQPESTLAKFQEDPRLREAQLGALTSLEEIADEGGMNMADRARMEQIQGEVEQSDRGRREAILQGMDRRGAGGSGNQLLAMLDSAQDATNRLSQEGLQTQALAQERALEAIMQGANLGGQVRGQDFDIAERRARAQDQINQFNTGLSNQSRQRNTDRVNQAREFNLRNQQRIADDNVKLGNFEQQYNKELQQQEFNNRMARAQGMSGIAQSQANMDMQRGQQQGAMWGGIGQGIGQIALASNRKSDGKVGTQDEDEV